MKRKQKKVIRKTMILLIMVCALILSITVIRPSYEQHEQSDKQRDRLLISDDVLKYESLIEKYAKKYDVADHQDILLAMMMQESGGRGEDPMQVSENYCGEIGCIDDPELSIKQGVHYFADTLNEADGDVKLAIQSYNFGHGFIEYVRDASGSYTEDAAIDFSQEMYDDASDKSDYTCLREEAEEYDACYGDIYYVRDVMEYKNDLEKT